MPDSEYFISVLSFTLHKSYLNQIFWVTSGFLSIFIKMFITKYENIVFLDQSAFFFF